MAHYQEIMYWLRDYAQPGITDQRAVHTFIDCETVEKANSLRAQLHAVGSGKYDDNLFQKQLGRERKSRHGTYAEWGKAMLLWMAGYKG